MQRGRGRRALQIFGSGRFDLAALSRKPDVTDVPPGAGIGMQAALLNRRLSIKGPQPSDAYVTLPVINGKVT